MWETLPEWLERAMIKGVVVSVVSGLLLVGGWALTRRMTAMGLVGGDDSAGRTVSSPRLVVLSAISAAIALAALLIGLVEGVDEDVPNNRLAWMGVVAGFAFAAAYSGIVAAHRWMWDADGISWIGLWRSRKLRWSELGAFGQSWTGNFFVSRPDGTSIAWSQYTHNYELLNEAVARQRPDLFRG